MNSQLLLGIFFIIQLTCTAQQSAPVYCNTPKARALKWYEKGLNRKAYDRPERLEFLRKAALEDSSFAEAYLAAAQELIARCKTEDLPFSTAIPFFTKSIRLCPTLHSEPYYYIGMEFYEQKQSDSAIQYLNRFIAFSDTSSFKYSKDWNFQIKQAKQMLRVARQESRLKRHVAFKPELIKGLSTERDEYLAYVTPDDENCFFVRRVYELSSKQPKADRVMRERFMLAKRQSANTFDSGMVMPLPFNAENSNQGACTISLDNKQLFFAMNVKTANSQGNVDLFGSVKTDTIWSAIKNLGLQINDPVYWDSQPSLSPDGNTLYFASNRPGGLGGIDLYVSHKNALGEWCKPENLGPEINTSGDEKTPFIHPDNENFYFSSNGHSGFGGYDIFHSRKNEQGTWNEPQNLGSPINGEGDDAGFFVSSNGHTGYFFSSDSEKIGTLGAGGFDVFQFEMYDDIRSQEMKFVRGQTKIDSSVLKGAQVQIKDLKTKKITYATVDTSNGEFTMAVKKNSKVMVTVKKDNVAFNSFIIDGNATPQGSLNLQTQHLVKGGRFILENIYYRSSSAEIDSSSFIILESLADYLKEHPKIKIEIGGHTDNIGSDADNTLLSKNRADAVRNHLLQLGVIQDRISAKGYGASRSRSTNSTAKGRAQNRRTEFSVIQL